MIFICYIINLSIVERNEASIQWVDDFRERKQPVFVSMSVSSIEGKLSFHQVRSESNLMRNLVQYESRKELDGGVLNMVQDIADCNSL